MENGRLARRLLTAVMVGATLMLAGCGGGYGSKTMRVSGVSSRECLARAMYFESIRSSDEGMLAVGTVVMNRVAHPKYPKSVCGVVGQKVQFAPGVLSRSMTEKASAARAFRISDAVLSGKRHPRVREALFFHTSGYSYPYRNMHYVLMAGGNSFYEKRKNPTVDQRTVVLAALQEGRGATPPKGVPAGRNMRDADEETEVVLREPVQPPSRDRYVPLTRTARAEETSAEPELFIDRERRMARQQQRSYEDEAPVARRAPEPRPIRVAQADFAPEPVYASAAPVARSEPRPAVPRRAAASSPAAGEWRADAIADLIAKSR